MDKNKKYNCEKCDNVELKELDEVKEGMLQDPSLVRYYEELDRRTFYIDYEIAGDRLLNLGKVITRMNLEERKIAKGLLQPIVLFIHSPGGDLHQATYLCDLIKASRIPVYTVVMGTAYSAASLIAMAGHKRYCFPHSDYMIHEGYAEFAGTATQVRDFSGHYSFILAKIRKFITENTKITMEQLEEKISNDWYINGGYALKYGLADEMVKSIEDVFNAIYKDFDAAVTAELDKRAGSSAAIQTSDGMIVLTEDMLTNEETIKIKYFTDKIDKLTYIDGKSDWIDLRAAEDVTMKAGEFKLIPLGVGMKLPDGYEAHIVPRSSTYKNFGIIQTNHCAVIDGSYCGDDDQWLYPAYALRDTEIKANDRICQFRIVENQPKIKFKTVKRLGKTNRGGIGSTGKK